MLMLCAFALLLFAHLLFRGGGGALALYLLPILGCFIASALSGSVEDLSVLTLDRHQTGITQIAVLLRSELASVVVVLSVPNSLADGGG